MQFPKIPKIPEKAVPLIILLVVVAAVLLFGNSDQTDDEPKGNNLAVSGTGLGNQPSSGDAVVEALSGYDAEVDAAMDAEERVLEKKVKDAVEKMAGVGKVHVTITFETGVMREYERDINYVERQTQETDSQGGTRTTTESSGSETVVVADSKPLLTQMQRAQIAGVLVVVEGGQDSQVLTRVRDAVRTLLGIDGAKVSVSAMG